MGKKQNAVKRRHKINFSCPTLNSSFILLNLFETSQIRIECAYACREVHIALTVQFWKQSLRVDVTSKKVTQEQY